MTVSAPVHDVVARLARGGVRRFHPSAVAGELSVDVTAAVDALAPMVQSGDLDLVFEIVCPECHATVQMVSERADVPLGVELDCYATDHEHAFTVRPEDVWVTYAMSTKLLSGLLAQEVAEHGGRPKPWLQRARAMLGKTLSPARFSGNSRTTSRFS